MRSLAGILLALILLGSSCGGSATSTVETSEGTDAASGDSTTVEQVEYESPIADFLGQDIGAFDQDEAAMMEQQREAERITAECMAEQGFEYFPRDPSEMMSFGGPPEEEFERGSDAWIAKYGFGISTQMFPQSMVGDLVGTSDENFFGPGPDQSDDPNQAYREGLSDAEREAYQEALYGLPPEFGPEGPEEPFEFEPTGCQFAGFQNGPGGDDGSREFYEAFGDEMQLIWERTEADSRVVAFNSNISSCVADEGLEWTSFNDVYEQFQPRLNELQSAMFGSQDPFQAAGLNPEDMSEREIQEFLTESMRFDPQQLALLAEIQADEIALAQAVIACGGGRVAEQKLMNEVRVEYEQAFLDENADALEPFATD